MGIQLFFALFLDYLSTKSQETVPFAKAYCDEACTGMRALSVTIFRIKSFKDLSKGYTTNPLEPRWLFSTDVLCSAR